MSTVAALGGDRAERHHRALFVRKLHLPACQLGWVANTSWWVDLRGADGLQGDVVPGARLAHRILA